MHTRKSDSLKAYVTFQPILPYLRRSWTTAWKKAKTKTSVTKLWWLHSCSAVTGVFWYVLRKFSFRPFGGSVTTCRKRSRVKSFQY